jgi:hypothetical protein
MSKYLPASLLAWVLSSALELKKRCFRLRILPSHTPPAELQ